MDGIIDNNLEPWLAVVASFVGAQLDADDRAAIEHGMSDTNVERKAWFEYAFSGTETLNVRLARDPGSSVVFVEAHPAVPNAVLNVRVATATEIFQAWRLAKRY